MEFLSKKSCIIIVKFAKNIIMTANNEKRIIPNLNYPIAFLSILIFIIYFLSLFDIQKGNSLVVSSLIWSVLSSGFIGANATVIHCRKIEDNTIIPAGATFR